MQGGDISNQSTKRLLFVYEGLLARRVEAPRKRLLRKPDPLDGLELDGAMVAHLWRIQWESPYAVDVLTFLGEDEAERIEALLHRANVPVSNVYWAESPAAFAHQVTGMPWYAAVYHASEEWGMLFGGKGVYVPDTNTFTPYGDS